MANRYRRGLSSQNPEIKNLYSESQSPLPRQRRPMPPRRVRNAPKAYTATSYIGPPGTYCHGQRPPPQEFEPDYAHEEPPFDTQHHPTEPHNPPAHNLSPPSRPPDPISQRIVSDPKMIPYTSRPWDPWERCWELGCTKKGLHHHHLDEPPLEHKRPREVYSDSESSDDDYRDWRRRRAAKQKKAGHAATYRRPREPPKSLIASDRAAARELEEALPVPSTKEEAPAAAESQGGYPGRGISLPMRPAVGPARERWASSPPSARPVRRADAEHARGLPLRPAHLSGGSPAAKKRRVDTEPANSPSALPLRQKAPGKINPSVPPNPPSVLMTPPSETDLPFRPPAPPQPKKRRLVAAKDLPSPSMTTETSAVETEPDSIAGRVLRRKRV
ncbi:MAG: hypothetical protein HETSPECPRED_002799 [Heterodermia speciosa]|uniref:Uncharacterized protein n=1 Tax=Heterodermia speciosa TaxID=116794 RepID=A0A8H3F5X6_9LECA|nr:MAG: hypothetical protein HETSPECPRED_002799 [Heterodermia speciosa]